MKDFENSEFEKIEYVRQKFLETAKLFGFQLMEPSSLELLSVLETKGGSTIRDDVYFFKDKGDREIALRFDFTVGLTRYLTSQKATKLPAKIGAFGGVWRYDEPQKGRYRFFHQWNIEIFGKASLETDSEVIEFTSRFFSKLELKDIMIEINHRKLVESYVNQIFQSKDPAIIGDILRAVDKVQKKREEQIIQEYEQKGYSIDKMNKILSFSKVHGSPEDVEKIFDVSSLDGWNELKELFVSLKNRNVSNIRINFGIVRGLDYYSGIVFEAFDKNSDLGALVGGGRYDSLTSAFGRDDIGATGVAGGVERIVSSLEQQDVINNKEEFTVSVLYVGDELQKPAINLASRLRQNGIPVDIDLTGKSLKKQMNLAANSNFAVIVAPKEYSSNSILLRNMKDGTEKQIPIETFLSESKSILN